jgi:hypothetical protein
MKSILLFLFGCITFPLFSQQQSYEQNLADRNNYIPFVTPENEWVVDYFNPGIGNFIFRYTFTKDSFFIDNHWYRELIYAKDLSVDWKNTDNYFRENNGIVHFRHSLNGFEEVLYNFNMGVGDTLPTSPGLAQGKRQIKQVGTYEFNDGIPRKKLVLESECGDIQTWIEGIGELEDLIETWIICSTADVEPKNIRCFSTNNQLLYQDPNVANCYVLSNTEETTLNRIEIIPNPISDDAVIQFAIPLESSAQLNIYNISGNKIFTQSIESGTVSERFSFENLPAGLYFYQINQKGINLKTGRLVKME